MSFFKPQNPGIGGLDELTDNEEIWVQTGLAGILELVERTAPSHTSGIGKIYVKSSDGNLYFLNDSGVETQLNGGGSGSIDGSGTINELVYWVDSDTIGSLTVATYPSLTEISYVKGVTSSIQTQLNSKASTSHTHTASDITDFDTEVSNNTDVAANTSARHSAVTLSGTPNYLTLSGQQITLTKLDINDDTNLIAGNHLTLTTNTLDVDDSFILNTGDVGTGVYDFGGATSFEIPNGAGGTTVDATGEVTVDSTSRTFNFYDGTTEAVVNPVMSKSITIENPTATEDISMFYTDDAITITKIVFVITGSTSVTTTIRHHTDRNNTGNEVVTSGTVANSTTTGNVVTSFNDATVPADSFIWVETTALSGTPTSLNITVFYRQDA